MQGAAFCCIVNGELLYQTRSEQMDSKAADKIRFLYTPQGFVLDRHEGDFSAEVIKWYKRFSDDKYQTLYDMGFSEKPA